MPTPFHVCHLSHRNLYNILRPAGPVSGVMRTYIKVGGQLNPSLTERFVMVDLILRGMENNLKIVSWCI